MIFNAGKISIGENFAISEFIIETNAPIANADAITRDRTEK
jgi:hypothetical protein